MFGNICSTLKWSNDWLANGGLHFPLIICVGRTLWKSRNALIFDYEVSSLSVAGLMPHVPSPPSELGSLNSPLNLSSSGCIMLCDGAFSSLGALACILLDHSLLFLNSIAKKVSASSALAAEAMAVSLPWFS